MSIYDLPEDEKRAYFRENKRLSRQKLKGEITSEEAKRRNREQYLKNKQRYKDKAARWNKKHVEYMRAMTCHNRLKEYYPEILEQSSITIESLERWLVANRDKTCAYCDTIANSIDHRIALSSGGTHEFDNLQLLCSTCNSWKGTRTEQELYTKVRQMYEKLHSLRN